MLPREFAVRTGAALGIMLTGTTTGPGGASLDWDRRARVTPVEERKISAPRLERAYRIERPATSHGSLAWSCARGPIRPDG